MLNEESLAFTDGRHTAVLRARKRVNPGTEAAPLQVAAPR